LDCVLYSFCISRNPPRFHLFPYTTLFRSGDAFSLQAAVNKKGSCWSPFWIGAEGRTRTGTGCAHYPLKIACLPISPLRQSQVAGAALVGLTLRGRGFYISLRHV